MCVPETHTTLHNAFALTKNNRPPGLRPFCNLRRKQKGGPKEKHRHSQGEEMKMKIDDAADLFDVIDGKWL